MPRRPRVAFVYPVGLYPQPDKWSCGPFALKHALVTLGRLVHEREIAKMAHPHWWSGTDEIRLATAAHAFDCDLPVIRRRQAEPARKALIGYLQRKIPVLLCVDDWGHWITVVHHERGRFVIIDSLSDPVLAVLTWSQLRKRWQYLDWEKSEDDPPSFFDLLPVKPRYRMPVVARFSIRRAQFLRRPENHSLALCWDRYLEDLLEICRPPSSRRADAISMAEFLRRHQPMLIERVRYWHGDIEPGAVERLLRYYRFVAETYGLVIPSADHRRVLVELAMLVAFWAASNHGIGPMYSDA